jgi:regulatory protein
VVRTLVEDGYVDDARFARLFAQDKRELEQWGSQRIRSNLLARGIARELVEEALAGRAPGEDEPEDGELARAVAFLRGRFGSPARDRGDRDRQLGVLLRKGYDLELALEALKTDEDLR